MKNSPLSWLGLLLLPFLAALALPLPLVRADHGDAPGQPLLPTPTPTSTPTQTPTPTPTPIVIFEDDLESSDTAAWSSSSPRYGASSAGERGDLW
jgi:hypothetical protein